MLATDRSIVEWISSHITHIQVFWEIAVYYQTVAEMELYCPAEYGNTQIRMSLLTVSSGAAVDTYSASDNAKPGTATDTVRITYDGATWNYSSTDVTTAGYYSASFYRMQSGMRFTGITIPKGSTITAAYVTFTAKDSNSATTVNTVIQGEYADNPATFSGLADFQSRVRTTASVTWNSIPAWTAETTYNSPDISTIVQEIVDRAGWASGNSIVIFWGDDAGSSTPGTQVCRRAYSYHLSTTKCPTLHIEYTFGTTTPSNLYEHLNTGNDGDSLEIYGANWTAQQFTVGTTSHSVNTIKLLLKRVGSPSTVTVSIRL